MNCRITLASAGLLAALVLSSSGSKAQDVHFTQFDATPLILNPALTGAFNGEVRASVIYRDQWRSALGNAAFKTFAASVDMPIIRDISVDDYLAAGIQLYNDRAGDGNLSNTTALASVAYHKFLGTSGKSALSVGLQGGYSAKNLDISRLYFGDDYLEGYWNQGYSNEFSWLGRQSSSFIANAGVAFSQAIGERSSFVIGGGVNNVNQPFVSFDKREDSDRAESGLRMRYTGQLGAVIGLSDAFSIRPAVLYQSQAKASEIIGGAELNYKMGDSPELPDAPGVFAGGWYRHNDAIMITAGVEFKGFRIGVAYDLNTSGYSAATNGNGGFEIMIRYIAPSPISFARELLYPCGRF